MKATQLAKSLLSRGTTISEVARQTGLDRRRVRRIRDGIDLHQGRVGRPPYPESMRTLIRERLCAGKTVRQIASEVGVSIFTVARIKTPVGSVQKEEESDWHRSESQHGIRRCPACGGMIIISPCRACRVRDFKALQIKSPFV